MSLAEPALLALEDGSVFHGLSVGAQGNAVGEAVFNTSMTGYQEILTDPSYARQLLTLTHPHIGNVGVNEEDRESGKIHAGALILRDCSLVDSNWRARQSLPAWLKQQDCVAIAGIDTRKLTRLLRRQGALRACVRTGPDQDEQAAIAAAREFPGLAGMDLAHAAGVRERFVWQGGVWRSGEDAPRRDPDQTLRVFCYDFGVKDNLLRCLHEQQCELTVVPAKTSAEEVLAEKPDGVLLSNGPGDPEPCDYAIHAARVLLEEGMPVLGICLGHQILALASGAKTVKMKFGHHGANHPVRDLESGKVLITSQNHGFAVDMDSLPPEWEVTHVSLFDGSLQGMRHRHKPALGFQGHPEASPGPHDAPDPFRKFVELMRTAS